MGFEPREQKVRLKEKEDEGPVWGRLRSSRKLNRREKLSHDAPRVIVVLARHAWSD